MKARARSTLVSRCAVVSLLCAVGCGGNAKQDTEPTTCPEIAVDSVGDLERAACGVSKVVGTDLHACATPPLPAPPSGRMMVDGTINVVGWFDGTPRMLAAGCNDSCAFGYTIGTDRRVTLCAAACEAVHASPDAKLEIFYGCW